MTLIDEERIKSHVREEIIKRFRRFKAFAYACNRTPNDVYLVFSNANRRVPDWMLDGLGIKVVYQVTE